MIQQIEFRLPAMRRGCHLITGEITRRLSGQLPQSGLLNVFVKHTSCGLTINENADPDVRTDMDKILDHIVPEWSAELDNGSGRKFSRKLRLPSVPDKPADHFYANHNMVISGIIINFTSFPKIKKN